MTSPTTMEGKKEGMNGVRVGAYTLETLTTGMYADPLDALREYIQNSLDGVSEAQDLNLISEEQKLIEISVDRSAHRLKIRDNGAGILSKKAFETLTSVGMSRKDSRRTAGFRGIGRLAGIAYCSNLIFRTSRSNEPTAVTIGFDCVALRKALIPEANAEDLSDVMLRCVEVHEAAADKEDHYFEVVLDGMIDCPPAMLDAKGLDYYLCQRAPVDFDAQRWPYRSTILEYCREHAHIVPTVSVVVHDENAGSFPILKPYKTHYKTERKGDDCDISGISFLPNGDSQGGWWGWIGNSELPGAINDKKTAGIRFRVKNIQIGDRNVMDDRFRTVSESYVRFNGWYIGEIYIEDPDVIPNGRRDGFEDTAAWRRIAGELETVARELSSRCYQQSQDRSKSVGKIEREVERLVTKAEDKVQEGFASREQRDSALESIQVRRARVEAAARGSRPESEKKRINAALKRLSDVEQQLGEVKKFGSDSVISRFDRKQRLILRVVFDVLKQLLDQRTFEGVQKAIMERLAAGDRGNH